MPFDVSPQSIGWLTIMVSYHSPQDLECIEVCFTEWQKAWLNFFDDTMNVWVEIDATVWDSNNISHTKLHQNKQFDVK